MQIHKYSLYAGILKNADINTRDVSWQINYPEHPETSKPLLAAVWEIGLPMLVDVALDLNPNTAVVYRENSKITNKAKPLFFHVCIKYVVIYDNCVILSCTYLCYLLTLNAL